MAIALAVAVSLASGYLLVAAGWSRSQATFCISLTKLSLAVGFGLAISSASYFAARMVGGEHFLVIELFTLSVLALVYLFTRRGSRTTASGEAIDDISVPVRFRPAVIASFVITIAAAVYSAILRAYAYPNGGGWDAFAIWNLHARFLFLGGNHWRDGFNVLIPWSHPDYPLLLPASIARFWTALGYDSPAVPAILGLVFTFATLTLLVTSLYQLRGRNAALLAGIVLSATPFFIEQGTAQYADVPLSFFILASMVLLQLGVQYQTENSGPHGLWALAGVSAGFAAWTKNEGLLFLIALSASHLWFFAGKRKSQRASRFASDRSWDPILGAFPVLALIAWFKGSVATAGDLFSSAGVMLQKMLTPSRYWAIVRWYFKEFFRFGDWWIIPGTVLLAAFYILTRQSKHSKDPALRASVAILGLTFAGYFAIYLITPRDIYWHLRFSLNRLFLQLWPASLFLFFLFVARRVQAASQNEPKTAEKV